MAVLHKVYFTLEYKEEGLGGRWKDSKTDLRLYPKPELVQGRWETQRGSDIDSSGGSDHAAYVWNRVMHELYILTAGWENKELTKTLVILRGLNDFKLGARSKGDFYFRGKNVPITWKLELMEYTP